MLNLSSLRYDKEGLIPVIVQDYKSNEVLMLGYATHDSLRESLKSSSFRGQEMHVGSRVKLAVITLISYRYRQIATAIQCSQRLDLTDQLAT